jgi:hypothetical protein
MSSSDIRNQHAGGLFFGTPARVIRAEQMVNMPCAVSITKADIETKKPLQPRQPPLTLPTTEIYEGGGRQDRLPTSLCPL